MINQLPLVSIIILNWNGSDDTVECLESLREEQYENKNIIIVDNGSVDKSVENILIWLQKHSISFSIIDYDENGGFRLSDECKVSVYLIRNSKNMGFAAGNNIGIRLALFLGAKYVSLLNNDTVVKQNYLGSLVAFLEENRKYLAACPLILYYNNRNIIWYGGAKIFSYMYLRKYYNQNKDRKILSNQYIDTSLVTGCSLMFEPLRIGFLSEDFFYGEEDYEFSLRILRQRYSMACIFDSVIYHKVGMSIRPTEKRLNKICLYYVNRFVHIKRYNNLLCWYLTIIPHFIYVLYLLCLRNRMPLCEVLKLLSNIYKLSKENTVVSHDLFDKILKIDFSYK